MIKRTDFSVLFFHKKKPYFRKKYPRSIWENGFKFAEIFKCKDNAVCSAGPMRAINEILAVFLHTYLQPCLYKTFFHACMENCLKGQSGKIKHRSEVVPVERYS
jgi:hypothetical protein